MENVCPDRGPLHQLIANGCQCEVFDIVRDAEHQYSSQGGVVCSLCKRVYNLKNALVTNVVFVYLLHARRRDAG